MSSLVIIFLIAIVCFVGARFLSKKEKELAQKERYKPKVENKEKKTSVDLWEQVKKDMQKINQERKKEKENKTNKGNFAIQMPEDEEIEINFTTHFGLIQDPNMIREELVRKEFLYQCFPVTWEVFLKLNKYEKILAYSVKGCNDIGLLTEVYKQMFKGLKWQSALPEELKKDIRSRKRYLYEFSTPVEIKNKLSYKAYRYYKDFFLDKMPQGSYFLVSSSNRGDDLSEALDNTYFFENDECLDMYYPPNYYGDISSVRIIEPRFFKQRDYYKNCKHFDRFDLKPHPDYDFNIPKYIINHYLDMESVLKDYGNR
ncbi:hypothetical protein [Helicobacter burdigaliensis]|uniref:hypothetical protein n=1 Tax=Helicobacter burdigaliensis TaxID=2315334 RepID=UPI0018E57AE5|nr:hypothetical protein [Helicobacter burdigaliensis]